MATSVRLPQAGMAMTDGEVVLWHKAVGDSVQAGDVLLEVEAAKTTIAIEAPVAGVLTKIVAEVGMVVPVSEVLGIIDDEVGDTASIVVSHPNELRADAADEAITVTALPTPIVEPRRQVTPVARKLAAQLGIDLAAVIGSGPGGRVTDADVSAMASVGGDLASVTPEPELAVEITAPPNDLYDALPLSGVRGTIARRMHASLANSAQLTLTSEVDVTEMVRLRPHLRNEFDATYTDLLVRASILALQKHPRMNSTVVDNEIRVHAAVSVGIAVSTNDALLVPVLRDADTLSLREIVKASRQLVARAREGKLSADEMSGGTFTLTNLGSFGIDSFTPILNAPEVAILGVGRIVERLYRKADGIEWRKTVVLSLTIDHRAVDGVPGAEWLQTLAKYLADPTQLLDPEPQSMP